LGFYIGGIINPSSAITTGKFVVNIIDSKGALIDSTSQFDLTIVADKLKSA
jgi:hypothetical protein